MVNVSAEQLANKLKEKMECESAEEAVLGFCVKNNGQRFYVDDAGGPLTIYIPRSQEGYEDLVFKIGCELVKEGADFDIGSFDAGGVKHITYKINRLIPEKLNP